MAQAPPPPPPSPPLVLGLPTWVMEDFCQKMDCLNDYDWMRFASRVITDQTELRKIKCMEKSGISITRELMWWWGVRLATVQQLLELLQELQLYMAAQVIEDWKCLSLTNNSVKTPLENLPLENIPLHSTRNKNKAIANGTEAPASPNSAHSVSGPVLEAAPGLVPPSPPPTSMDLPHSLQSHLPVLSSAKPFSSSIPQQETLPSLPRKNLLWTPREVEIAVNGFNEANQIHEGIFANAYKGQGDSGNLYVVKRLKEAVCGDWAHRFFHTEVQICFRCCHHNVLQLLGFSVEKECQCLIYPYMPNASLMDRLQCQGGSELLTWDKRIRIAIGLTHAIQSLHHLGIIHGNVKRPVRPQGKPGFLPASCQSGEIGWPANQNKVTKRDATLWTETHCYNSPCRGTERRLKVLAEILTGIKAMDEGRHPIFLKDVLLDEIQMAKKRSCSKEGTYERLAAEEICGKYQDPQAERLSATTAMCWAAAICVCLRKKNPDMAEMSEIMERAAYQIQEQKVPDGSIFPGHTVNTPEETNDEPASSFNHDFSDNNNYEPRGNAGSLNCAGLLPPVVRTMPPEIYSGQLLQIPCESDESSNFSWDPAVHAVCHSHTDPENIFPTKSPAGDPEYTSDFVADHGVSERREEQQERMIPEASAKTEIKINDKKKKLMENILLYKANKLNTSELFRS